MCLMKSEGSKDGYHFIIKEPWDKFNRQFEHLSENTEKYKIFFCSSGKRNYKNC